MLESPALHSQHCCWQFRQTALPMQRTQRPAAIRHSHACRRSEAPAGLTGCRATAKSDEYSKDMQAQMGGTLTYRHEDGINYAFVLDDVVVGSCLQTPQDVDRLADKEGIGAILCLQEDSDMAWFNLDVSPIEARCKERGDIQHIRFRIRDFDPFDLRIKLPAAVQIVADQVAKGRKVYIHCTAGMGRAPATALAYMFYCRLIPLEQALQQIRAVRACNPRVIAVRQAACDILVDAGTRQKCCISVARAGTASQVQVAGLNVGWGQKVDLPWNPATKRYEVHVDLPVGRFPYKFLFDGRWTWSADHPLMKDGDNFNNFVEVSGSPQGAQLRSRLMQEGGNFTAKERRTLQKKFAAGVFRV